MDMTYHMPNLQPDLGGKLRVGRKIVLNNNYALRSVEISGEEGLN